jgi:hypothetical protein
MSDAIKWADVCLGIRLLWREAPCELMHGLIWYKNGMAVGLARLQVKDAGGEWRDIDVIREEDSNG